jgi:hypothetical protein
VGCLIERTGLSFHNVAYSRYDACTDVFWKGSWIILRVIIHLDRNIIYAERYAVGVVML